MLKTSGLRNRRCRRLRWGIGENTTTARRRHVHRPTPFQNRRVCLSGGRLRRVVVQHTVSHFSLDYYTTSCVSRNSTRRYYAVRFLIFIFSFYNFYYTRQSAAVPHTYYITYWAYIIIVLYSTRRRVRLQFIGYTIRYGKQCDFFLFIFTVYTEISYRT